MRLGDYARAEVNARDAVTGLEAAEDREGYPQAVGVLGGSLRGLGCLQEALDCHLRLVAMLRSPGYEIDPGVGGGLLGVSLNRLGLTYAAMGNWDLAVGSFDESASLLRRRGLRGFEGEVLLNSGRALRELGREAEARARFYEALRIFDDTGEQEIAATVRAELLALASTDIVTTITAQLA